MLYTEDKQLIAHVIDTFVITPAMDDLGKRIRRRRESLGLDQVTLAKRAGISQPTLANLESGKNQKTRFLAEIARELNTTAEWLSSGDEKAGYEGAERRSEPSGDYNAGPAMDLVPGRFVAIVGIGQGGPDGYISIDDYPVGQGDGEIFTYSPDPNAYAIRVRGDSMRPRIKSGEYIVAEPNTEAMPGDDVVVKLKNDKAMVKELLWQRDGEVSLGSINASVPPITIPSEEIVSIHRVAAIVPRGSALIRERK